MCFYLRNWQVTFLLYTLGVKITEYIAKAPIEPRDYRVVFLIQKSPGIHNRIPGRIILISAVPPAFELVFEFISRT
jgi:hypothetical protein